ncbi:MAG: hypothetical protein KKA73_05850 [Chloroflexi bacterium]|nr:hypothetical protein [Chloroflexota bacterium]MBU1747192.1 hypothetical protein [Chloroflexota bacterium]MBU1879097.1 hypothetical protein [Chloroflexota bacterium]
MNPLWTWAADLGYDELGEPAVLDLLRRHEVTVGVPVTPARRASEGDALLALLHRAAEAGVNVALWPLLDDGDGRQPGPWACERNIEAFSQLALDVLDWTAAAGTPVAWLVVDLQLPRAQAQRYASAGGLGWIWQLVRLGRQNLSRKRFMAASAAFQSLYAHSHERGVPVLARCLDQVATDMATGGIAWQDFLETPVTTVTWDRVALTYYGSMVRDMGLTPVDVAGLLYQECQALQAQPHATAVVSLGLCGGQQRGAYARPADLVVDVAAALAAGIQHLALADLAGVLRSPEPAAWFDLVRTTEPAAPAITPWAQRTFENRKRLARIMMYFQ